MRTRSPRAAAAPRPPSRPVPVWLLAGLLALAPGAFLRADRSVPVPINPGTKTNVKIDLIEPTDRWDGNGFMPVDVRIQNDDDASHEWQVDFQVTVFGRPGPILHAPFTFTAGARRTTETIIYVPGPGSNAWSGTTAELASSWRGPGIDPARPVTRILERQGDARPNALAASHELYTQLQALWPDRTGGARRGGPGERNDPVAMHEFDPTAWPADWRVWSPFNLVVLGANEFAALDGARQAALRDWVALGGRLILEASSPVMEKREEHGLGNITTLNQSLQEIYDARFATDAIANGQGNYQLPLNLVPELGPAAGRHQPWTAQFRLLNEADREHRTVDPHVLGMMLFLLGFALLTGPINLFFIAPTGRRHRLFVTVPALSILASLGLAGYILAGDGVDGQGTRKALVMLLPGENKAAVFQEQVSRTGVLLGQDFKLAADLAATEAGSDRDNQTPSGTAPILERTGNEAGGEWFRSRLRQSQDLWRITPTRARLELVGGGSDAAAPVVQSSLTTELRDFTYSDPAGKKWRADRLPPGQRVTLQPDLQPWAKHPVARWFLAERRDLAALANAQPQQTIFIQGRSYLQLPNGQLVNSSSPAAEPAADPAADPRVSGNFYALGGPGDLAPLTTSPRITWIDDSVIYTGRVEAARQP